MRQILPTAVLQYSLLHFAFFFVLGIALYASAPWAGSHGNIAVFVGIFCVILSMYGGGFATIPAYLADVFGTQFVGAIHGRLLTAWSTAGILGPVIVNYMHDARVAEGVPPDRIVWVRPRDPWMLNRAVVQPDPVVGLGLAADTMAAAADASSLDDLFIDFLYRNRAYQVA